MARKRMSEELRRANQLVDWLIEDSERIRRMEQRERRARLSVSGALSRR